MKKIIYLLPILLGILACGIQPQPASNVANMVNATLTAMAQNNQQLITPAAPTSAPSVVTSGTDVSYSGTSFTIPSGLASGAQNDIVPQSNDPNVPMQVYPAYTRFTLQGYPLQGKAFEPQVLIYPAKDFARMSDGAKMTIDNLQNILLAQRTSSAEPIPFLPMINAGQIFHAQEKFLSFKNGTGIRYITQFDQAPLPINNTEILYTFQGLTSDGAYYVSVTMPVNLPFLPGDNSVPSITPPDGVPFEMDMTKYPGYLLAITDRLNHTGNSFNPSLESLDALVQSLNTTITSSALPANPSSVQVLVNSTPWKIYRNDVYGFTFEYPAIYDEAPYSDTCGIRPSDAGIHLGHQIDLFFLNANGLGLTQFTDNLIQTKGWSVDSQTHDPINGLEAAAIQYRFGGTNRFGTFTLVKQGEQIFAFNFSAGGFCEVPADQPAEPAAYSHMIETFQLNK